MTSKIDVILCKSCKGKGVYATGKSCKDCMGVGVIGNDGKQEYFLGDDGTGNLKIVGIKSGLDKLPDTILKQKSTGNIVRWMLIVVIVILYCVYLGVYFFVFKDQKIFNIVTTITAGFVFMLLLYDIGIVKKFFGCIGNTIFKEPEDLISAVKRR